jgi:hypothetical protein
LSIGDSAEIKYQRSAFALTERVLTELYDWVPGPPPPLPEDDSQWEMEWANGEKHFMGANEYLYDNGILPPDIRAAYLKRERELRAEHEVLRDNEIAVKNRKRARKRSKRRKQSGSAH